jgi:dihydrofolate synthase/folylpolyglutamate synthase
VNEVLGRIDAAPRCPVITVGGTNGKGSACAMLECILRAAGYRVGLYTSPHLLRYNERVRVAGREASDAALCDAFAEVEDARRGVALTYFEFGTLAAARLFARAGLEALVLEVGLGGRLDAVNAFDPDCAVLTSVAIDHVEYLGASREEIGREKAGIFRSGKPAVVSEPDPPQSVLDAAERAGARLLRLGRDFFFSASPGQWTYRGLDGKSAALAHPALRGAAQLRNASAAIAALEAMRAALPVAMQDVRRGLAEVSLPGRFQVLPGRPQIILDVAHNAEAAATLAANLGASGFAPETHAVFGMLRDKDIAGVVRSIAHRITRWHLATLGGARGASARELARAMADAGVDAPASEHESPATALAAAQRAAEQDDKIVVFGSFLTVAGALARLQSQSGSG